MAECGMEQIGQVAELLEGRAPGRVKVRVRRVGMCATCGKCASLAELTGPGEMLVEALNPAGALPGDLVKLEMKASDVVKAAAVVYVMPLVGLAGGYLVGCLAWWLFRLLSPSFGAEFLGTAFGAAGAVAGVLIWYLYLKRYDREAEKSGRLIPTITQVFRGPPDYHV